MTINEAIFALDRRAKVIYSNRYGELKGCWIITGIITRSVEKKVFSLEIGRLREEPEYAGQIKATVITGLDSVKLRYEGE